MHHIEKYVLQQEFCAPGSGLLLRDQCLLPPGSRRTPQFLAAIKGDAYSSRTNNKGSIVEGNSE